MDWAYIFVQLNEGLSHAPLSSEGHISAMTGGVLSVDTHGWLHQLQICKLLQHKDRVICPEGLNGKLEALQFTFEKLPLWDAATPSKPACEPQLIEVDLGSEQPESATTVPQTSTTTLVLPLLWWILWSLLVTSPQASTWSFRGPWHSCSRLPLEPQPCLSVQHAEERATVGGTGDSAPNRRNRRSPWATGDRLGHPCPNGNSHAVVSAGSHPRWHLQLHSCYLPTAPAYHAKDTRGDEHVHVPPRVVPITLSDKCLPLQERMNTTLKWLLTNRATGDLCHKELDLNTGLAVCLNKAQAAKAIKQATEAIKQAKVHQATTACALQQADRDSVLEVECQMNAEERWDCQAFMEAFGLAIWACLPKNLGILLYPLQHLTSNVLLATLLGMSATAQLWALADGGPALASSIPCMS